MSITGEREQRVTDIFRERARGPGGSPSMVYIDRVWRFFCSVRIAAYEIFFLALLVLFGTLKGSVIPAQIPRYVPALEPVVKRWYAFDVFHSLIFSFTLALLTVAIVICTINRVPGILRSIGRPSIATSRQFFQSAEPAVTLHPAESTAVVTGDVIRLVKAQRYRVLTEQRGAETHIYADKHRFGKLGTFPFHLALILILVGGIVGSEFGFREQLFAVPEGSVRAVGRGTGLQVRLERFFDSYNELGAPSVYRSDLVIYEGDHEVRRGNVTVNNPLTYRNVTFYQSSYGQAASLTVTNAAGEVIFEDSVAFTFVSRTNPDAPAAFLDLPAQGIQLTMVFPNLKVDETPEIGDIKLGSGELYIQGRNRSTSAKLGEGTVVKQGQSARIGDLNVQFQRERRFTLLQVAYNPGIPILFAAAILLVLGLVVTFAFPHRRIRALVSETDGGTEVLLAPLARRDWGGQRDFMRVLGSLEQRLGAATAHGRWSDVNS